MSIRVLNIMTGGLRREGIASTQLEFYKRFLMKDVLVDIAAVHENSIEMISDFESIECRVVQLPDRKKHVILYMKNLYQKIKQEKYEIIHVHGSSSMLFIEMFVAILAGVPVRIVHSRNTRCDHEKINRLLRPLFKYSYTHAFACGHDAGKWLFGEKTFTVVHNGKDFSRFCYADNIRKQMRKSLDLEEKIVVGHVGRMNQQKNHEYLLKVFLAFHQIKPNSILYLIGDGPLRGKLENLAKELNIREYVTFAGSVSNVEAHLQAMDIMVFPSKFEGLPNVVLEWQAEGLPCLISENITRECAPSYLVEFMSLDNKPEKWANKMVEMLDNQIDRASDAIEGIKALSKAGFDIEECAIKLEQLYCDLANENIR